MSKVNIRAKYFGVEADGSLSFIEMNESCCAHLRQAFGDKIAAIGIYVEKKSERKVPQVVMQYDNSYVSIAACPFCGSMLVPEIELTLLKEEGLCVEQFGL